MLRNSFINKLNCLTLIIFSLILTASSQKVPFEKDCTLCKEVKERDIRYAMNDFVHKDSIQMIAPEALAKFNSVK